MIIKLQKYCNMKSDIQQPFYMKVDDSDFLQVIEDELNNKLIKSCKNLKKDKVKEFIPHFLTLPIEVYYKNKRYLCKIDHLNKIIMARQII